MVASGFWAKDQSGKDLKYTLSSENLHILQADAPYKELRP